MAAGAHPVILHYKSTLAGDFPLIMVVGREPNDKNAEFSVGDGPYDFAKAPRCAFWNVSHAMLGKLDGNGIPLHTVKARCANMQASPIIYADALPITLKNAVIDKNSVRDRLDDEALRKHVEHVFSHEAIMRRVGLVMLSGLNAGDALRRSSAMIEAACKARNIPAVAVPFFYPTNTGKIMDSLTPATRDRIRAIWTAAMDHANPSDMTLMTAA